MSNEISAFVKYADACGEAFAADDWGLVRDGRLAMHHEFIHNGADAFAFLMKHDDALLPIR